MSDFFEGHYDETPVKTKVAIQTWFEKRVCDPSFY